MTNLVYKNNSWYQGLRTISMAQVLVVGIFIAVCIVSVGAYRWYNIRTKRAAYQVLTNTMMLYKSAIASKDKETLLAFADQVGKYAGRYSFPINFYFAKFQANALMRAGNKVEGLAVMENMVSSMSVDTPLYYLFKTEYAILLLDSEDALVREKAITMLQEIAHDSRNGYPEMAFFYLGRYYFAKGLNDQARTVWSELVQVQHDALVPSVWAQQAEALLAQLP